MQYIGAVRIDDALGIAGSAGGVTHAGGVVFVDLLPVVVAVALRQPCLVGDSVLQRRRRHVRVIGHDDVALDLRQLVGELFEERHEGEVRHHDAVLGVIDDPDDLLGEQPRVDGVIDAAASHTAVPGFKMPPGVPRQRRDAVAGLDARAFELLGDAQGAVAHLRIIGGVYRPFDRAGNHLPFGVVGGGVVDDPVTEQRPVLHETEH